MTYNREFTSDFITELKPNEICVFGSNIGGFHGGGAARVAHKRFGAEWGVGEALPDNAMLCRPWKVVWIILPAR